MRAQRGAEIDILFVQEKPLVEETGRDRGVAAYQ